MAPKTILRLTEEEQFASEFDKGEWQAITSDRKSQHLAKIRAANQNLKKGRGGARPNAGRKTLGNVKVTINVQPETRAILMREAGRSNKMGAVIDRWAAAKSTKSAKSLDRLSV